MEIIAVLLGLLLAIGVLAIAIYWYYCLFQINKNILPAPLAKKVNLYIWVFILGVILAKLALYIYSFVDIRSSFLITINQYFNFV